MAEIVEEGVVVRFSRITKRDSKKLEPLVNAEVIAAIETAMGELYGSDSVVVEVDNLTDLI